MTKESKLVQRWLDEYGIHSVMDAEDYETTTPQSSGWDLNKVWTCWDSYDQMGTFVSRGFTEKYDAHGELFVSGWFLGTKDFKDSSQDVTILDREVCEECDTEGCEACDDLGWIETDYLAETSFGKKMCANCGVTLEGKFCSNCGQATS